MNIYIPQHSSQKNKFFKGLYVFVTLLLSLVIIYIIYSSSKTILAENRHDVDDFYKKLNDGMDVNVLVVGDSIGAGSGATDLSKNWISLLTNALQEKYEVNCKITNISMGGNTSYAGYVRTMVLKDNVNYDLAIICYGQNDREEDFSLYYESIIRAIQHKYKKCEIISVLESSQRNYTTKIQEIQQLCSYYYIPTADTISAFNNSGIGYENLTKDGIHPSDEGQEIYSETIKNVISNKLKNNIRIKRNLNPYNKDVVKFESCKYIGVDELKKVNETTFEIQLKNITGVLGIDYSFESGDNVANIYIDNQLSAAPTVSFNYDFSQRHIIIVNDDCNVNSGIRLEFGSSTQAGGFRGIIFSNVDN